MATRAGRPVGWVSLAPRDDLPRLVHSRTLAPVDDHPAWSIVCFVVSEPERAAERVARCSAPRSTTREYGATTVEAHPTEAGSPTGTVSMFERAGFEVVATRQAAPSTRPRQIMRRELSVSPSRS